jgi:ribonuclease G
MNDEDHKTQVRQTLSQVLERDYARTNISEFTNLGLIEMTRKRTQESLTKFLCEPCQNCHGKGMVKSVQTICYEIFRELQRESNAYASNGFLLVASHKIVDALMNDESSGLGELEISIGKPIKLQAEMRYPQEMYDLVLM